MVLTQKKIFNLFVHLVTAPSQLGLKDLNFQGLMGPPHIVSECSEFVFFLGVFISGTKAPT